MAKPETLPYCQGLSLWERWHGVSRDGEGKPASKRQIYEKALVFQGENLERREPVNSNYRTPVVPLSLLRLWAQPLCTIGFLRRIAARVTVGVRQSLLTVQPCRSGASNRSPLHPPCTTRRLSARRRKSFYPRQRICTLWKVGPFYHGCQKLSRSFLHNKDETLSRYGLQTVPELKSPGAPAHC